MIVCLDLETTGLNPKTDHIIEVAIVQFDHEKIIDRWSSLVKPPVPISAFTTHLTGISNAMVADAPSLEMVRSEIEKKLQNFPIMGHFIQFDTTFLRSKGLSLPNLELDTCQLAQAFLEKETSYSLEVLAKQFGIEQPNAHRALDDVLANIELYRKLREHIASFNADEKAAIQSILDKSTWSWRELVEDALKTTSTSQILKEKSRENPSGAHHFSLQKSSPQSPFFLFEEATHTLSDLVEYAKNLNAQTLLVVPQVDALSEEPDLGVLKHPSQYLDTIRFENFLKRPKLDANETVFACKIQRWSLHTQNGEKREIRLAREEINLWNEICCEESTVESFYKKAKDSAEAKKILAVSHIHFLKDRSRKDPLLTVREKTVLGFTEELVGTIEEAWHLKLNEPKFLASIQRQFQESSPQWGEKISTKVSMVFGLLGVFFKKYNEAEAWQLVLAPWHWSNLEWNSIKQACEGLEALLTDWPENASKELYRELHFLIRLLTVATPNVWLSQNKDGQVTIHNFPSNTKELFETRVWAGLKNIHAFGHQLTLNDGGKFVKNELHLPSETECLEVGDSTALPLDLPKNPIASPNDPKNLSDCVHEITGYLESVEGDIFILVNSAVVMENLFHKLNDWLKKKGRKCFVQNMSGGLGKMTKMAQGTLGKNCFIGNEDLFENLLRENHPLTRFLVHKLPFRSPTDPIQIARSAPYPNAYTDFSLPSAGLHFRHLIDAFLGEDWNGKRFLILDPRLTEYETIFI